jgi:hypothetical protein
MADFIDCADVGMVERRSGAGFPAEAVEGLRVLGNVVRKEFQGDEAPKIKVLGPIPPPPSFSTMR